ncbi:hypothetical protein Tco_1056914 [Tanacetum coccineum]|uniref:Uncharacterized protein n=1 Tax=Tanacetum coccineum TaxID=301880 RepID=A0ABQ5H5P1_9ASTR
MSNLKFAETHNLVTFLEKPKESDGFEGIIDFLNASSIRYTLTVNPTIYTSCIKQFWAAKAKTINGGSADTSPSRWEEELERMGYENLTQKLTFYKAFFSPQWKFLKSSYFAYALVIRSTAWNDFSSTMASAIILFLDKQVEGMTKHKEIYVTPSHTKKVFANMKRGGKGFSGRVTPLFQTMMVQAPEELGEGLEIPSDPQHTPTIIQPSTSQPQKKQPRRKQRKDTKVVVSRSAQVFSSNDEDLGAQEDASKQGRKIVDLDADAEKVEVEKAVSTAEVTTVSATTKTIDELTLAQTLIEIKAAKPRLLQLLLQQLQLLLQDPRLEGL